MLLRVPRSQRGARPEGLERCWVIQWLLAVMENHRQKPFMQALKNC